MGSRLLALGFVATCVACGGDGDNNAVADARSGLLLRFQAATALRPDPANLRILVEDRDRREVFAESFEVGAAELGVELVPRVPEADASFSVTAELRSLRGRLLGTQRLSGPYPDSLPSERSLDFAPACVYAACLPGERCIDGVCRDACTIPGACPESTHVFVDSIAGVDTPMEDQATDCRNSSTPCLTPGFALDNYASPGVVFELTGSFGDLNLGPEHSGTADAPVVVRSVPGGERATVGRIEIGDMSGQSAWITVSGLSAQNSLALFIREANNVVATDLTLVGTDTNADASSLALVLDSQNVTVSNSTFEGRNASSYQGFNSAGALRGLSIVANDFVGFDTWAIQVVGDDILVRDNVVRAGVRGILVRDGRNALVQHNRVCGHREDGVRFGTYRDFEFSSNVVAGGETALGLGGTSDGVVRNCVFVASATALAGPAERIETSHNLFDNVVAVREMLGESVAPGTELEVSAGFDREVTAASCGEFDYVDGAAALTAAADGGFLGAEPGAPRP